MNKNISLTLLIVAFQAMVDTVKERDTKRNRTAKNTDTKRGTKQRETNMATNADTMETLTIKDNILNVALGCISDKHLAINNVNINISCNQFGHPHKFKAVESVKKL